MKKARALLLISVNVTVLTFLVAITPASALPYTMLFDYASVPGYGTATASGWIQLESTVFLNPTSDSGFSDYYEIVNGLSTAILGLSITVTGASSGNGTFGMTDFQWVRWYTNGNTMDMAQEVIGQTVSDPVFGDYNFGDNGNEPLAGDFGFVGIGSAPTNLGYFILETPGNDLMQLTSLRPDTPVPEPSTFMLLAGGFFGLGLLRRRIFT